MKISRYMCAERNRSGTPYLWHKPAFDLKGKTAAFIGVACTVLKLIKALVGLVIILGETGGEVFKHLPAGLVSLTGALRHHLC